MAVKDRDELLQALSRTQAALELAQRDLDQTQSLVAVSAEPPNAAVHEFARTVNEVLGDRPLSVDAARRAGLLAAAGQAWEGEVGPLLSSAQVRELLGGVSRQRVDELLRGRRLIGLRDAAGRRRFPAVQFLDGKPLEPLVTAHWLVADAAASDWTAASWLVSPDDALEGRSPAAWAREGRDSARLLRVSAQDAARLAR